MDYSPPGSFVLGILQARILEWVAMSSRFHNHNTISKPGNWYWCHVSDFTSFYHVLFLSFFLVVSMLVFHFITCMVPDNWPRLWGQEVEKPELSVSLQYKQQAGGLGGKAQSLSTKGEVLHRKSNSRGNMAPSSSQTIETPPLQLFPSITYGRTWRSRLQGVAASSYQSVTSP